MLRTTVRLTLACALLAAAVPAWAGEVKVSFSNGLVTIVATDVSPRQILAEWARLGQVRITNLERLAGGPTTLVLTDVSEVQALETLLRGTAGYVAAPRAELVAASSRYDRILLLPGVAPTLPPASAARPPVTGPGTGRGRQQQQMIEVPGDDPDEDENPSRPAGRDQGRPGQSRPFMPGQATMPGMYTQPQTSVPGMPSATSGSSGQNPYEAWSASQRQGASPSSATVPGGFTAPPPLMTTPLRDAATSVDTTGAGATSAAPGQPATQPGVIATTPSAATRPGIMTSPFPTPGQPQSPDGLQTPGKPTTPTPPPAPPAPIKKSGGTVGPR